MTSSTRPILAAALMGCLAACSDGGGDGPFASLDDEFEDRIDEVGALGRTDPATLPTSGAATYEGVAKLDVEAVDPGTIQPFDLAGEVTLTANFAGSGDPVTGSIAGVVGADDAAWDGTLIVSGGAIDRGADPEAGDTFTADLGGTLTAPDGTAWDVAEAGIGGDFAGEDASHVLGSIAGQACAAGACSALGGVFVAEAGG